MILKNFVALHVKISEYIKDHIPNAIESFANKNGYYNPSLGSKINNLRQNINAIMSEVDLLDNWMHTTIR
jgi:hypothetical protein